MSSSSSGFTGNIEPRLRWSTVAFIGLSVSCAVFAQLALELGTRELGEASGLDLLFSAFATLWVPAGILSYAVGTSIWLMVLRRIDLAVAYPLGSSSLVVITLLSAFRLGEQLPAIRWAGIALIVAGIWVIGFGERRGSTR